MGFRFRKRISLGGIAHLNFSATGASFSVGGKGANINLGGVGPNRHPRVTLGLPGTGLSYQERLDQPIPYNTPTTRKLQPYTPATQTSMVPVAAGWVLGGIVGKAIVAIIFGLFGIRR
jgi:hypothetical protein